jgi:hypothetical protein
MDEKEFKPIARLILGQYGLRVLDVPTVMGTLTPDFEVHGSNSKYAIELKIKGDNPDEIVEDLKTLRKGKVLSKTKPVGPRNTLSGIIKDGIKQMMEHDPERKMFRVIWLHAAGQDPQHHFRRFQSTIFGTESLMSIRLSHIITCYYFHNSAFHLWRNELDGAILTYQNNGQLCINTLSPKVDDFRQSDLVIGMSNGLCDPEKLDEGIQNGVIIADCDLPRNDTSGVISYLQKKYAIDHLQPIPMMQLSGTVLVDPFQA